MKHKLGEKIISLILTFNLVFTNFAPFVSLATVRAQDVTPEATVETTVSPTEEPTPTEEISPTVEPTQDVTPTETVNVTPTVEVSPVETTTPPVEPTLAPVEAPSVPSPPSDSTPTPEMSVVPTSEPIPTITPLMTPDGHVETQVIESYSCRADSLNGCLITDKDDYAPTDVAVITGYGFAPNTSYTLRVYSTDEPATDNSYQITTDSNGSFTYSYQLDGTYRPNYTVELKDSAGFVVATVTFTDSPPSGCQNDSGGANDETGQKDLTKMCADYTTLPSNIGVKWNWDDISWSGANTGDACALFDTDSDGNINYALCVGVNGNPASKAYTKLYSCNDSDFNNCKGSSLISSSPSSTCTTSLQNTDPFGIGSGYPQDTEASCNILTSEVGGTSAVLTDVCSYPSGSPSSSASDCIIYKSNTYKITVTKTLVPSNDSGTFNLQVDGTTYATGGDGTTTFTQVVSSGSNHTVGETGANSTSLSNYNSVVVCKKSHGTGSTVLTTGTNPWTINKTSISDGDDVLCTITNTRINNASLTIIKDAVPNDPQDFSFTTSGTGLSSFSLDDDTDNTLSNTTTFNNLAAGTYSVTETIPSGWTQTSATCNDSSPVNAISLSAGENVTCTFTNTKKGHIVVDKVTNPSGDSQSFDFTVSGTGYTNFSLTDTASPNDQELLPGNYSVSETVLAGWDLTNTSCVSSIQDTETAASLELDAGETITCTFTNTKRGSISGYKYDDIDGDVSTTNDRTPVSGWTVELWRSVSDVWSKVTETVTNIFGFFQFLNLVPGQYEVKEVNQTGWSPLSPTGIPVTLGAGQSSTGNNFVNTQYGKIIVKKTMVGGNGSFVFSEDVEGTISTNNGTLEEEVLPGQYIAVEEEKTGWDLTSITCDDDDDENKGYIASTGDTSTRTATFNVHSGEIVTCTFTNSKLPTLTLQKTVVTDDGGTATKSDFQGKINGNNVDWDTAQTLSPGTYTASETGPDTYTPSDWGGNCAENGSVTLAYGDNKICTITNDDIAPKLTLYKNVIKNNGGTAGENAFGLSIGGVAVNSGETKTLKANQAYTIDEEGLSGYEFVEITGDSECPEVLGGTITLKEGDEKSCTITNDDQQGKLKITKIVLDPNGNEVDDFSTDFEFTINGGALTATLTDDESETFDVNAGSYLISEEEKPDYVFEGCDVQPVEGGYSASVSNGGTTEVVCTNKQKAAHLTVVKNVVANDESEVTDTSTSFGFSISDFGSFNLTDEESLTADLNPGTYQVSEDFVGENYEFLGCTQDEVTLGSNENVTVTCTNKQKVGDITVTKFNDENGNGIFDENEEVLSGWMINLGESSQETGENGTTQFNSLLPGTYPLSEDQQDGWKLTNMYCTNEDEEEPTPTPTVGEGTPTATPTPVKENAGTCHWNEGADKWNALGIPITTAGHQNHEKDFVYEGNFDKNGNPVHDAHNKENPELNGDAWCEVNAPKLTRRFGQVIAQDVVGQVSTTLDVRVEADEQVECFVGNQQINPELHISKSNDAAGDKSQGDIVTYTLKVKALKSKVLGVVLKDLLPNGFIFQSVLSIIKNGTDDITASVGNPNYASPGTYNLGDMKADDEIIIKYTAKIGSSVDPGLYKDLAYASGTDLLENRVLASSQPEGYVTDNFVGTTVSVNANLTQGGNVEIGGEVLGASTYLPATGGNAIWIIIATVLSVLGLIFMGLGIVLKKKRVLFGIILGLTLLFYPVKAEAAAGDLNIRLEQPKSPTSKNDFNITFTVMDLSTEPADITVKCFKKGPSEGGYSQFGSDITVSAGGNSGNCSSVSTFVNTNGTYQFYATATKGADSATSESEGIISVGYNTQGDPTPPSNYSKEKISSCQYRIKFRTADDGMTTRVEVYRSENTSFNLDGGTRVGDISIGPNQDGTFEEAVPDCNKTYYYVIRSFNGSGNPSGPVGDSAVTVTTSTTASEGGAIPVEGVTLPGGGGGAGQILGEEEEASPTAKPEVVEVKEKGVAGAVKGVTDFVKNKTKLSLLIGLGVLALGYGAYYFIKKRRAL